METLAGAYRYFLANQDDFWRAVVRHLELSFTALLIALIVCVPLGIWAAKRRTVAQISINTANGLRVVPSLAILFLAYPYLGTGFRNALVALTILACPPILINTYAAFRSVDRSVVEAARGMGMAAGEVIRRIELPLALPVLIAGVRIATIEVIASATLAAYIAAGGLGNFIQRGFATPNGESITLVGAIPIAVLALAADALLAATQRAATSYAE